jgi:tetratricopeptide (TPR) repeat protein
MAKSSAQNNIPPAPRRRWLLRILLAVLAPVVFLLLLEGVLALTGLVPSGRLLQRVEHEGEVYWTSNARYGRIAFNRQSAPMPPDLWLSDEKPEGVRRVVVIGESAAQGFPLGDFNLARVTEAYWNRLVPDDPVEFIDLTMTGVNSHHLLQFVKESTRLQPDLIIVYAGHNEAIGPYGPASMLGRWSDSVAVIRATIALRQTRLGQLMQAAVDGWGAAFKESEPEIWRGLGTFAQSTIAPDDARLQTMEQHVYRNLRTMIRFAAGRIKTPMLIAAPAANLNDWPPLASEEPILSDADALRAWREGEAVPSADQAYRLAGILQRRGEDDAAWSMYRRARDLDTYRFRADSRVINAIARATAGFPAGMVTFINADESMRAGRSLEASDRDYFLEHVHLTFAGRVELARIFSETMARQWHISPDKLQDSPSAEVVARDLLFTGQHEHDMWMLIRNILMLPPFNRQEGAEDRAAHAARAARQALDRFAADVESGETLHRIEQGVALRPGDPVQLSLAALLSIRLGDQASAFELLQRALARHPFHRESLFTLARLQLDRHHLDAASALIDRLAQTAPENASYQGLAGELMYRKRQHAEAVPLLKSAIRIRPVDPQLHYNLGNAKLMLGKKSEAIASYEQCLNLAPSHDEAMGMLAWALIQPPQADPYARRRALDLAVRAVELNPRNPMLKGPLAAAYAANRYTNEAFQAAMDALAWARTSRHNPLGPELAGLLAGYGVYVD